MYNCTMVARGHVVASSRQTTEVEQRRAQVILEWVTGAHHAARHVWRCWASLSYHAASVHPAVIGTWWN